MADITEFPIPTAPLDPAFQVSATHVQWRLTDADPWVDLVPLSDITGPQGPAGADGANGIDGSDGREVEFRVNATHVQWRYVGEATWTDLVALSTITGPQGPAGADGSDGLNGSDGREVEVQASATHIQWRYVGDVNWVDLVALSTLEGTDGTNGTDGSDGREVELQTNATHVQWRYVGDVTWTDLVALSTITGPEGPIGPEGPAGTDGREVELQTTATHIQWRYVGDVTWTDLVARNELARLPHVVVTASKTLALSDANTEQQVRAAATISITSDSIVNCPEGTKIPLLRFTTDAVTISAVAGVTLNGVDGGSTTISNPYDGAVLTKGPADTWAITGGVEAVA